MVDEPSSGLTTPRHRDIEAQVRPLMLAIMEVSRRGSQASANSQTFNDNWNEVFKLVRPSVLNVLRYVFGINKAQEQDDMFQEVIMRFWRYHLSYDPTRPL